MKMIKFLVMTAALLLSANAHAAFNGTGTFNRLYNWETDKANGINVRADRMDAEMDGMATGLSTCVTKDGQTTLTNNLPMATFKLTNVGNATALDQYAAANQVRDNTLCTGTVGGAVNAYTFQRTLSGGGYVTGTVVYLTPGTTNTSPSTLNLDGMGVKQIYKGTTVSLTAGDLISGTVYPLIYDGAAFQLMGGTAGVTTASVTPTALVSGSTSIQVISGTLTSSTAGISFTVAGTQVARFVSNSLILSGTLAANSVNATNAAITNLFVGSNPILFTGFTHMLVYTGSGNFVPSYTTPVFAKVWGPGGNGGSVTSGNSCGGGGGGGGYSEGFLSLTALSSNTVTVGTPGSSSTFSTLTAGAGSNGVTGSLQNTNYDGGAGGSGSGGTLNLTGAGGDNCIVNSASGAYRGSRGGYAAGGGGGSAQTPSAFNVNYNGAGGLTPGGGGSGSYSQSGATTGGNGANGMVIIYYP